MEENNKYATEIPTLNNSGKYKIAIGVVTGVLAFCSFLLLTITSQFSLFLYGAGITFLFGLFGFGFAYVMELLENILKCSKLSNGIPLSTEKTDAEIIAEMELQAAENAVQNLSKEENKAEGIF